MTAAFETAEFQTALLELMTWRRDVRSFRPDPLPDPLIESLLEAATLAPSVGLSQAWRFMRVRSESLRTAVRRSFERCNEEALAGYTDERAALYAKLKLAALEQAPEQIAVFSDQATETGRGLGRQTMPEMLDYSVVAAIQCLWLMARAHGVGVGWVSILDPEEVADVLAAPRSWKLIAYLCLGRTDQLGCTPELERRGWEERRPLSELVVAR